MENLKEKGITLVSLTITVLVLLILAGIIIATNSENNGVYNIANDKKQETEKMYLEESIKVELKEDNPESYEELIAFLRNYGEIINEDVPNEAKLITSKGNYEFLVKDIWNIEKQEVNISIGDYVEYNYDRGSYEIKGEVSGTGGIQTLEDNTNGTSIWKVIDVNENYNQIKIVPTTLNNLTVTLKGINGFNNGVKILNDVCNEIYSNTEYNTTARNINIEDIEKISNNITELRTSNYGFEKKYTQLIYPSILENERDISLQKDFFDGTKEGNNFTLIQTYYLGNIDYLEKMENIIPKGNFWISSRAINNENNAQFYIRSINIDTNSYLSGAKLYESNEQVDSATFSILPVVTLTNTYFYEGNGTEDNPYKFIEEN